MHVVWEKFCRYFDVEPRIVPLQAGKYTVGPEDVEPHVDENTIGVAAVRRHHLHRARRRRGRDQRPAARAEGQEGARRPAAHRRSERRLRLAVPLPDSEWDFRLEQVRSINASGHKFGLVYPGIGWLIFREKSDLAEELVFSENYLGKTDATFTLNFSTGSAMVLAQYYNFVRFGKAGYRRIMEIMQENAKSLAGDIEAIGKFQIIGKGRRRCRWSHSTSPRNTPYDEFDIAFQLAAERGWMVPAYKMPPNAQDVKMMRALVKLNLARSLVDTLHEDISGAIATLEKKGPVSESERKRVKTSVTH